MVAWSYVKMLVFAMHKPMKTRLKIPHLAKITLTVIKSNAKEGK